MPILVNPASMTLEKTCAFTFQDPPLYRGDPSLSMLDRYILIGDSCQLSIWVDCQKEGKGHIRSGRTRRGSILDGSDQVDENGWAG